MVYQLALLCTSMSIAETCAAGSKSFSQGGVNYEQASSNRIKHDSQDIGPLEEALIERCVAPRGQPEITRSYTHYH